MPWQVHPHVGDDHRVHLGSKISLRHLATGRYVRSSSVNYQGGSGQQLVYASSNQPEHEDWWQVLGPEHQGNIGDVFRYGDRVRVHHMATFKWLHSHDVKSPSSGQNEVSTYGTEQQSDENDIWIVEKADGGANGQDWNANDVFLLKHERTGQNEVSTYGTEQQSDANDIWIVEKADGGANGQEWHANDVFLLKHERTGAYLHSHDIQVNVNGRSGNEVTTFNGPREDQNNQFGTRFG
ncbi:hypothetical protein CONCODRAFT_156065 [Conidiobolus coronatus NRRL 28638]|uniref:MIR domain-containing protein n=1 Tax=Conidiobolus coronatus (strain ATCC 28846 / CBS 209.66 / NRRL 28638) TaxID=796925 RepID=A0A137P7D3_CONC2|nr:hypothetical protein CONCODRAFT_156065 [Conidiobolus coronatus NRRL 28638]|eukprot:KXN70927.1 hypothetical protein CONCODRAFT_156065 [Conidiobolus coronatus NRRL 28638]